MPDSTPWQANDFYFACREGDLKKARATRIFPFLDQADLDGNTPLHIASSNGHTELVQLLFRYHADRTQTNKAGLTAEQMAKNDEVRDLFKKQTRPKTDATHFVDEMPDVEWLDNYKNAYRIAYENREHMRRWLLKVPLNKLLNEIDTGYIEKMEFSCQKSKDEVRDYLKLAIEGKQPSSLVYAYSSSTGFCKRLNHDLANIGSNFRFLSTQNLFNSGYLDNEAPKGLGQHIFTAILINHPMFRPYHQAGTIYRGMSITPGELTQYNEGDIVLTRSFLSTSEDLEVAKFFIPRNEQGKIPVLCIYKVINPRSSLHIKELSIFYEEKEALIVPFVVFRVTQIVDARKDGNDLPIQVTISLEEVESNVP